MCFKSRSADSVLEVCLGPSPEMTQLGFGLTTLKLKIISMVPPVTLQNTSANTTVGTEMGAKSYMMDINFQTYTVHQSPVDFNISVSK